MSKSPPGGPATIGGVIYQMLWCLCRLAKMEIREAVEPVPGTFTEAVLVLEPAGGGGDAREHRGGGVIVTQIKARSDGRPWSLQAVITEVFPDLLKAVSLDGPEPTYEFVTEGEIGAWDDVEAWFGGLAERDHGGNPMAALTRAEELRVGGRSAPRDDGTNAFWTKDLYSEAELFEKIVVALGGGPPGDGRRDLERRVWRLLAHFRFRGGLTRESAEAEIDANLRQVVDHLEDVTKTRLALLGALAELARKGNAAVEIGSFFEQHQLKRFTSERVSELLIRGEVVLRERLAARRYLPAQHVQREHTQELQAMVRDHLILVLSGPSGGGKSWHTCALAAALARSGALVAHVDAAGSAQETLDAAMGTLWNTVKGHDAPIPHARVAARLPGPPSVERVLLIDGVEDPAVARTLATTPCESLGVRLVLACSPEVAKVVQDAAGERALVSSVRPFRPSELNAYLAAQKVRGGQEIPHDVRKLLASPLLARLYCDAHQGSRWSPASEYELFQTYWESRLQAVEVDQTLDLGLLRELARGVLSGKAYPWGADVLYDLVKHEGSLGRLRRSGWLLVHPGGSCSLWHDRLLNWLLAATLVEDLLAGARTIAEVAGACEGCADGSIRASGRPLGYVPMDALWLLAFRGAPAEASAAVLAALERTSLSHTLYTELVPTLGARAVGGLLGRLEGVPGTDLPGRVLEIASCLARLDSPEAVAKARQFLSSDDRERRSVGLHILRRQGDPASLERLWALHLEGAAASEPNLDYQRRLDAIAAAIALAPTWLESRLAAARPDTPGLAELVYQLARLPGGDAIWQRQKSHLKEVVPPDRRRCLTTCVRKFMDQEEREFIRSEARNDTDFAGDMALATLLLLDPDAAIAELAASELKFLAFTRGWHLHPLLAARPEQTLAAVRALVPPQPSPIEAIEPFRGAENEIDVDGLERVLDVLERVLVHELKGTPDPSSGPLHGPLEFLERIHRPDLLERLRARRGGALPGLLGKYLLAIGPRRSSFAPLTDRLALRALQAIGDPILADVTKSWLGAASWYGRMDGLAEAHKHADDEIVDLLRGMALATPASDNGRFEAYLAVHGLCLLEDWDTLLEVMVRHGLSVSPYPFEHRRGKPPLAGAVVDEVLERLTRAEATPGLFLAAALARDDRFAPLIRAALHSPQTDRDTFLSAAIAADLLEMGDPDVVAALAARLEDTSLHERLMGFLLSLGSPSALAAVAAALDRRFDPVVCEALGRYDEAADRAAALAWKHRESAKRTVGFGLVLPLLAKSGNAGAAAYLEDLAFGHEDHLSDDTLRTRAIEALAALNRDEAFSAALDGLGDPSERYRGRCAELMMTIDPRRGTARLLEQSRQENDEEVELAIADALSGQDIEEHLLAWLESDDAAIRRVGCVLASRRSLSEQLIEVLRRLALNPDGAVVAAAIRALREDARRRSVEALVRWLTTEPPGEDRWVLIDTIVRSARGTKDTPPTRADVLAPLGDILSPLELRAANEVLRRGREEFERGARDRTRRKLQA